MERPANQPDEKHPVNPNAQSTPGHAKPMPGSEPDKSAKDEQPLGWDQAPVEQETESEHRHPRQTGEGGVPEPGEDGDADSPMGDTGPHKD